MTDPRTPVDDLRAVGEKFRKIEERLAKLEAPSGTQAYQAVKTLQSTVDELSVTTAELADLVANLEDRLDSYLATEAPAIIDARVATQIAAILAGNVTIGGNLTVNGPTVKMIGVHDTDVSGLSGRFVVWVAGDGTVGHT